MNEYEFDASALANESDVEQKVLYPLLTNPSPIGLGFDAAEVQTKSHLARFTIDKGKKELSYVPDYVLSVKGIPVVVVEAKKPGEDLVDALREASLYASAINRQFPASVNPCQLVISSDGMRLLAGWWDSAKPDFEILVADWIPSSAPFVKFWETLSRDSVSKLATQAREKIRPVKKYFKPITFLGGKGTQGKITTNDFGERISIDYRHLFNPDEEAERVDIVHNAYVPAKRDEARIGPIDKLIRKKLAAVTSIVAMDDSGSPKAIIEKLTNAGRYNNHVLLLVGSVGAGKSTFATYLKEVALDEQVVDQLVWVTLDLNNAPVSKDEIYSWVKNALVGELRSFLANQGRDCDHLDFIRELFEAEIERVKKGPLSLISEASDKYAEHLYKAIAGMQADLDLLVQSYIRLAVHAQKKELIIVLDNCDKRKREEQMLMFEVANWIKDTIKAIVFLPLRDTTYDHFGREKPLDTVVKDLTFRIAPPPLFNVLNARLQYAGRLAEQDGGGFYTLRNGMRVQYPAREEQAYLRCILTSLFQRSNFKRLITGLSGGDIRVGLEIFLDFCKSGHISEANIFKMRQSNGEFALPDHVIARVCMRGDRIFYTDPNARVKNLFQSDPSDELPDPFVRISILQWLGRKQKELGPTGIPGFHQAREMIATLESLGHDRIRVVSELLALLRFSLVVSESQDTASVQNDDLISISSTGIVHLDLLSDLEYLATIAEDVWFTDEPVALSIARNIGGKTAIRPNTLAATLGHAEALIDFLEAYFGDHFSRYQHLVGKDVYWKPLDFQSLRDRIEDLRIGHSKPAFIRFDIDSIHPAFFVKKIEGGVFVDINHSGQWGFVPDEELERCGFEVEQGGELNVKVVSRDDTRERYRLAIDEGY